MRNIKYNGQGTTVCPWGMTSFAGGAKIVGSLGCMNCVNHAGQSYTADGGVVCCLRGETEKVERTKRADGLNGAKRAERPKRAKRTDGSDGVDGLNGRTKRVTKKVTKRVSKKVSRNNNKKTKKEEKK